MRERALLFAAAVLTAATAFPQTDEWKLRMGEGAAAEIAGEYAKAAVAYRAATEIAEGLDRRDPRRTVAWNALGTMYDAQGRFPDAESAYRRALHAAEDSTGKTGSEYGLVLGNLASLCVETGQNSKGEKLMRESLRILKAADPPNELRLALTQTGLGEILVMTGKFQEAERNLMDALTVLQKNPQDWGAAAGAMNNLGAVRFFQGNLAEAGRLFRQSLSTIETHLGNDHPMLTRTLHNLAALAHREGHREEAGEWLRRGLSIAERRLGTEHPFYGLLLADYAGYLRAGGEKSKAKEMEARSNQVLKDSGRRNGIGSVVDITALRQK